MKFLRLIPALVVALLFVPQLASAHLDGQSFVLVNSKPVASNLAGNFYAGVVLDLAPQNYQVNQPITFAVDRTVLSSSLTRYRWVWPGGQRTDDPGTSVTHAFPTTGSYTVTLQSKGLQDPNYTQLDTIGVNVLPSANYKVPAADITVTQLGTGRVRFTLTPQLDPSATLADVSWNFGDKSTGTDAVAEHTYTIQGDFKLTPSVEIKDSNGLTRDIIFNIQSLDATFGASPYQGQAGATVKLTQLPQSKPALVAVGIASLLAVGTTVVVVLKTSGKSTKLRQPKPPKRSKGRRG